MPKVGEDNYPYTKKGIKDAREHSKRSGKPLQVERKYAGGGMVPKYRHGGRVSPNNSRLAALRALINNAKKRRLV